jgi:DeoR family fructose operon transcriptional repressor
VLAVDRRHRILERVAEEQTIHIAELARDLEVSEMTIRRDIARLERDGYLRRTYGGATAHLTRGFELAFNARALQHAGAKRMIGIEAARLVPDATTIFVGIGTTAEQFARYLPPREDRTVITESIPVASLLGTRPGRVVALGGTVRRDELSFVGPAAMATIARYRSDVAVLGAAALSAKAGFAELFEEEAENHRMMIERSGRVIVLADGSKFGQFAPAVVGPASLIDVLVTDADAPRDELEAFRAQGVQIHTATGSNDRRRARQLLTA